MPNKALFRDTTQIKVFMPDREITFSEAIREATYQKLEDDQSVYVIGLGAPDPKGLFGTTTGLQEKFGSKRVMDMPISENALTGIGIGSAIMGMRPIMTHQRVDFFLLSLDQLINNASKWHYMFGGKYAVPMVFRLFIGRGWGQGPQHSQSLHSIFAHIPGLKVVMPSTCYDAKGLLISAIEDNNPVVFLEHRWLHSIFGHVPKEMYRVPIGKAHIVQQGNDLTVLACSHMTLEAWKAIQLVQTENISIELIDIRSIVPLDKDTILESIKKTKKVLVIDPDWKSCGFSAELLAMIAEEVGSMLQTNPVRITYPDHPCPTSWTLSNHYYPTPNRIAAEILKILGKQSASQRFLSTLLTQQEAGPMDVPDKSFTGPF